MKMTKHIELSMIREPLEVVSERIQNTFKIITQEKNTMTKIYYATTISTTGESVDSIRIANNLRQLGYEVYAAAENKSINDKSNDPTPDDIYDGDVPEIKDADIVVVNITGGLQDGTMTEVGFVTRYNEAHEENVNNKNIKLLGFTTSTRLLQPQHHKGMASASASALALGMIEKHGTFVGNEHSLYEYLRTELSYGQG